jgi:hypothetical protein
MLEGSRDEVRRARGQQQFERLKTLQSKARLSASEAEDVKELMDDPYVREYMNAGAAAGAGGAIRAAAQPAQRPAPVKKPGRFKRFFQR